MFVPYYQDTTQEIQHLLLGHKVQASRQTDGLDISSALIAAGAVSQDSADAMAIGKAIYKMLQDGVPANRAARSRSLRRVRLWINRYRLTRLPPGDWRTDEAVGGTAVLRGW